MITTMASSSHRADIESTLSVLDGLRLIGIGRAADMATLAFGAPGDGRDGRPEASLHVQCPWRLESDGRILTGRGDLFQPEDPDDQEWLKTPGDYDKIPNLQDARLLAFNRDLEARNEIGRVESIRVDGSGGFEIDLSGGYRLSIFPAGSRGECWRLLRRGLGGHFVVPPEN